MRSSLRAMGLRPSVVDSGGGLATGCKLRVQLFADASNGWPHSALWYGSLPYLEIGRWRPRIRNVDTDRDFPLGGHRPPTFYQTIVLCH